ncbi:sugar ABC transporter substrate-binding protein [Skermania sp. ID1734]|uniref:ABC transporter substrate-binding protein n=1 Tax=Skermania sp. ID1734 TaxID=2597516 RepID=UPI001180C154|nr:sugar ABC transporter substrate-binding protein [Skermania sp. ID1734]TSD95670.1 sugar ABC transporter substrate-binding protein [Skermania sp. ID1734]
MASGVPAQISRRRALRLLGAGAALPAIGVTTGCHIGWNSGSPNGPLDLVFQGDATQQKAFNKLFAEFHRTHPDIEVAARGIAAGDWATFAATVSTQIAGGKGPDIVDVATEGQKLFAAKGLLTPLDEFIAKDRGVVDAYYAGIDPHLKEWTNKYGSTDGKTYYIPGGYNPVVMYCNTEVFEKAGVELPERDWSWADFRRAGQRIKDRTGAFLLPIAYNFPFVDIMPWLLTNGASTFNADWTEPTFDSEAAVEAATYVKSLLDAGLSPRPGGAFEATSQFKRGKLATLGGGRWPTLDLRRLDMVDKTRIVNWPFKVRNGTPIGWDGWPILKTSQKKEKAWTFLEWMMSADAARFYAQIGGTTVPALRSVALSEVFLKDSPKGSELLAEAIRYGTPMPSPERGGQIQTAVVTGWQAAITGTKSVKDALADANTTMGRLL